jgi:hypothetical protein
VVCVELLVRCGAQGCDGSAERHDRTPLSRTATSCRSSVQALVTKSSCSRQQF